MVGSVGCVASPVQLRPPSVERNTPVLVPANRIVPLTVRALMTLFVG
jgi:hypothetical protein